MKRIGAVQAVVAGIILSMATINPALPQDGAMPERFLGLWQPSVGGAAPSCAPNDADIRIEVLPDRMEIHEGGCEYSSIVTGEDGSVEVALSCGQEDEEWEDSQLWRIADSGSGPLLTIEGRTPGREFEAGYGLCRTAGDTATAPREAQCYESASSTMKIVPSSTTAQIEIDSVQGGAHMCFLSGTATKSETGLSYTETIDGIGECALSIMIDRHGNVRLEDRDWNCKRFYCGARAAFEHIMFSGTDRQPC